MKPAVLLCNIRSCEVLAEALLRRADLEIITLAEAASAILKRRGIDHRPLDTFLDHTHEQTVIQSGKRRVEHITHELNGPAMRREWSQYDDAAWAALKASVSTLLERDFLPEMLMIERLRACASEADLRLVITQEDISRDSKTVLYTAHQLGIPGLHVLHKSPHGTRNGHDEICADMIAVSSERAKRIYESIGADPDRMVVTGNPAWDIYARPPLPGAREQVCDTLGLDPDLPVVEYALASAHRFSAAGATHPSYHIQSAEATVDAFATLAKRHPDWQFLLRPHPGEQGTLEPVLARGDQSGLRFLRIDDQPAQLSLTAIDALACTHSDLGIEAILCGVPVVNVALDTFGGPVFREGMGPLFCDGDAVLSARTEADIAPQIEAAMCDAATRESLLETREETIKQFNLANDGKAAERVCTLALEMIEAGPRYVRPLTRFPEFEPAFATAIPDDVETALIVGRASHHLADVIQAVCPKAEVYAASAWEKLEDRVAEAVVLADPLPHSQTAAEILRTARSKARNDGVILAAFRHGADPETAEAFCAAHWASPRKGAEAPTNVGLYTRKGAEIILSRSDLEPTRFVAVVEPGDSERSTTPGRPDATPPTKAATASLGWVVCAQPRRTRASAFARARGELREQAEEANRRGELLYAAGDIPGAIEAFTKAVGTWSEKALYYNNLAVALYDANRPEDAWPQLIEALHCDPNLESARTNLRKAGAALGRYKEAEEILSLFGSDRMRFTDGREKK